MSKYKYFEVLVLSKEYKEELSLLSRAKILTGCSYKYYFDKDNNKLYSLFKVIDDSDYIRSLKEFLDSESSKGTCEIIGELLDKSDKYKYN